VGDTPTNRNRAPAWRQLELTEGTLVNVQKHHGSETQWRNDCGTPIVADKRPYA